VTTRIAQGGDDAVRLVKPDGGHRKPGSLRQIANPKITHHFTLDLKLT
jgi:hypothetical protein